MSYTYATFSTAFAGALVYASTSDPDFTTLLPSAIEYGEGRIYRDLDLLSTVVRDSTASMTANSRNFTLPSGSGRFITVQGFNVYTPAGSTTTRNPTVATSRDFLDAVWPSETASGTTVPAYFAPITDQDFIFGPPPSSAYRIEVIGTIRPQALSVSNTTTFLSNYLPDLFFAACMIFGTGWQRNFGAQAEDPKMAVSWEGTYQTLLKSAMIEELRRKWQSTAWSSQSPSALAPRAG